MTALLTTMRPESFRRLRLGQWVEDAGAWIAGEDWKACQDVGWPEDGTRVTLGFAPEYRTPAMVAKACPRCQDRMIREEFRLRDY